MTEQALLPEGWAVWRLPGPISPPPSRLVDEFQPPGRLERPGIKGADFGRAAYIEGHHQLVAGDTHLRDLGPLWQDGGDIGRRRNASPAAEKAIADGDQDGADGDRRGQAGDQHHPPHARDQGRLLFCRFLALLGKVSRIGHARFNRSQLNRSQRPKA